MKSDYQYKEKLTKVDKHLTSKIRSARTNNYCEAFNSMKYDLSHLSFSKNSHLRCMYIGCLEKKYYKNLRKKYKNETRYISSTNYNRNQQIGKTIQKKKII
jgi:hypothetical protein